MDAKIKSTQQVEQIITQILEEFYIKCKTDPEWNAKAMRVFGSMHRVLFEGITTPVANYDVDIFIAVEDEKHQLVKKFGEEIATKYSTKDIHLEATLKGGIIKPPPATDVIKILLHLHPMSQTQIKLMPRYVKHSINKYGTTLYGKMPIGMQIERIGLADIISEIPKRFKIINSNINVNWTYKDNIRINEYTAMSEADKIEVYSYSVLNNTANIMNSMHPYATTLPHYENSKMSINEFAKIFNHPNPHLPKKMIEIRDATRNGIAVNIVGLHEEVANFLSYNHELIRNISGLNNTTD